jgi:hypothetical protein
MKHKSQGLSNLHFFDRVCVLARKLPAAKALHGAICSTHCAIRTISHQKLKNVYQNHTIFAIYDAKSHNKSVLTNNKRIK